MEKYYIKLEKELIIEEVLKDFWWNDEEINWLINSFVESHNSSLTELSWTTYIIQDKDKNILWFFVINLSELKKNSKNKLFFERNNLNHEWYPVINLEFLIRKPWVKFSWVLEYIFKAISEIIVYIKEKINVKYIYINAIRKRVPYFEQKTFIALNEKSRQSWRWNIDMLLKV